MSFFPDLQHPLHLCEVKVGTDDSLEIIVRHAVGQRETPVIGRNGWDIMSHPTQIEPSKTFSISFRSYVAMTVRVEHFAMEDTNAEFEGKQFVRFKASRYLSYINGTSWGEEVHPGTSFHYGLYCLNQLIDIVSKEAPYVAFLGHTAR
ncbi:hypothetical protein [Pseudoduganella rhizocola]|uniref:hypothetical protein n=1 Tax=Pseudoduganella rhizocola TaxID=3382643 RepID=UPI0038B42FDE